MSKDNSGSAFPAMSFDRDGDFLGANNGMTLRDYFSAKAMQGVIASLAGSGNLSEQEDAASVAAVSYLMADAMLAERTK